MKKYPTLFFILLICNSIVHAQDKRLSNSLSIELGKTGLICNLTYDHQFKNRLGIKVGGGSNFSSYIEAHTGGGGIYYLFGKHNKHFETGIDLYYFYVYDSSDDVVYGTLVYPNYTTDGLLSSLNLGYRSYGIKTIFRIGFSPCVYKGDFIPGGYVGFGVRF